MKVFILFRFFDLLINFARSLPLLKRIPINFYRFVCVGVTGFLVDAIFFNIFFFMLGIDFRLDIIRFTPELGISFALANVMAVAIGTVYGYIANRNWSFENSDDNVAAQFSKYVGVAIINNILNNILFGVIFFDVFSKINIDQRLSAVFSRVLATSFQVVTSYILYKFVVFRKDKEVISETLVP